MWKLSVELILNTNQMFLSWILKAFVSVDEGLHGFKFKVVLRESEVGGRWVFVVDEKKQPLKCVLMIKKKVKAWVLFF